ncbi:hypothetical protein [Microbispora sp. NBC_01389]
MLRYVLTFLPWIVFSVLSTNGEARYGAAAGLLFTVRYPRIVRARYKPA